MFIMVWHALCLTLLLRYSIVWAFDRERFLCRGVTQSGSVFGLGPKGREFESHRPDH